MVAERVAAAPHLLAEPDTTRGAWGCMTRTPGADLSGAIAQRVLVDRHINLRARKEVAKRHGYSERSVAAILHGRAWVAYTAPVIEVLRAYGFWIKAQAPSLCPALRRREDGYRRLLGECADLLKHDPRPQARRVRAAALLLSGRI